jgi:hypothetical protein
VKGFTANSTTIPTKTALQRQILPAAALTIDGKRQVSNVQNLKAQCAFKLAELVETHRLAIVPDGDPDEITAEFSQIKQKDMDKGGQLNIAGDEVSESHRLFTGYGRHVHHSHVL